MTTIDDEAREENEHRRRQTAAVPTEHELREAARAYHLKLVRARKPGIDWFWVAAVCAVTALLAFSGGSRLGRAECEAACLREAVSK